MQADNHSACFKNVFCGCMQCENGLRITWSMELDLRAIMRTLPRLGCELRRSVNPDSACGDPWEPTYGPDRTYCQAHPSVSAIAICCDICRVLLPKCSLVTAASLCCTNLLHAREEVCHALAEFPVLKYAHHLESYRQEALTAGVRITLQTLK